MNRSLQAEAHKNTMAATPQALTGTGKRKGQSERVRTLGVWTTEKHLDWIITRGVKSTSTAIN